MPRLRGAPLAAGPLGPLVSGLRATRGHQAFQCSVDLRLDVCPNNGIVVADAKDGFFNELVPVTNPTDDYLDGVVWSITFFDAFIPRLDYRDDEIYDTLRESDTCRSERQIYQKLGTTLVFDEGQFRALSGRDGRETPVNERIGVRRVVTVETPGRDAHLQRYGYLAVARWTLRLK